MRPTRSVLLLAVVMAGCSTEPKKPTINRDTMTQRQKDSVLGATKLPGASNISRAQRAADSMSRQIQVTDTIH